jgi:hypothetical protein
MDSLEAALIHMPALQSLSIKHHWGFVSQKSKFDDHKWSSYGHL